MNHHDGQEDGIGIYDEPDEMDEKASQLGPQYSQYGASAEDGDYMEGDEEDEDMMDDEFMDKISSSPSIDDGMFFSFLNGAYGHGHGSHPDQRTLILNSFMRFTISSRLSRARRMRRRETPWCCWMTATAIGGWCGSSRTAALVTSRRSISKRPPNVSQG